MTDRQTDRQTDRHTDRQTDTHTHTTSSYTIKSDRLCIGNETNVVEDTQVDHRILITRLYMN